jgi:adenine deaminase
MQPDLVNRFEADIKTTEDFEIHAISNKVKAIEVIDHQLITKTFVAEPKMVKATLQSDIDKDILKITVINRYKNEKPALGFVHRFGLKKGALASSVAHDSHNIIAIGTNDEDLTEAVNLVIKNKGGISCVCKKEAISNILPLPIAGLMSDWDYTKVAETYSLLDKQAKAFGSSLSAPFMTLSFLALLVIPELKLSDQGLFDGNKFEITNLYV